MPRIKFKPENELAYDKDPVCFKVRPSVKAKLKAVPDWQQKLREYVDSLIAGQTGSDG
ncbi:MULTISPECIES: hypothetical protein [unclassified Microcoleus]|uniref:hypothetical protein n=1 Tax=unclassified Microcoleus TaxID=2642155 RepID=UPI002FD730BB